MMKHCSGRNNYLLQVVNAIVYPRNNNAFNATTCYTLRVRLGTASRFGEAGKYVNVSPNQLGVFPSPARDAASLIFTAGAAGTATLTITGSAGVVAVRKTIKVEAGANPAPFRCKQTCPGCVFY
jgi:hypothetical protein